MLRRLFFVLILLNCSVLWTCAEADGTSFAGHGEVSLSADTGIDCSTGTFQAKGNYANSDLFATAGSSHLKLATGGSDPTKNRPVNFFLGLGGIHETFVSLDDVPAGIPTSDMTQSLIHAKTGNGFVLMRADGGYTRGWITYADGVKVTIQYINF
jgi:hypothetical protein